MRLLFSEKMMATVYASVLNDLLGVFITFVWNVIAQRTLYTFT
ncbi:hypothetical protein PCARR_b0377 [Pseudoalteromonas carrageenovora IAM 12662]|uniref:GtrA-like protein domain-containing protein n=1 Tax=Pseudoalteromonas carrageenovora IAM 12662 TaxID=1314868 RepID=A0ABR9EWZ2_PSEVC|nr:hypothetical protein [Pseudoalteromonas carrageenovora IAM 12662]